VEKVICPYCNKKTKLVSGKKIYPHRPDLYSRNFYLCKPCEAYVGTHKSQGGKYPLGTPANMETRYYRGKVHESFDVIWRNGQKSRSAAYKWLADQLGIETDICHIAMFDTDTCLKALEIIKGNNKRK